LLPDKKDKIIPVRALKTCVGIRSIYALNLNFGAR